MPTPRAAQFSRGSAVHANGTLKSGRALEDEVVALLPTPTATDPAGAHSRSSAGFRPQLGEVVRGFSYEPMLPTPRATRGGSSTETAEALLPTPQTVNRASRRAMLGIPDPEGNRNHWAQPGLEQALELAQGILPREFESWDEVPGSSRPADADALLPTPAARDFKGPSSASWREREGVKGSPTLPDALLPQDRELLPTPTVMDTMASGERTLEWWDGWRDRMKSEGYGSNGLRGDSLGAAVARLDGEGTGDE